MKVKNIGSNQTVIETNNYDVLVSYETPVACYDKTACDYFYTSTKYSATTSRHINKFLPNANGTQKDQEFFNNLLN